MTIRDGEVQCNKTRLKNRYLILFLFLCHSLLPLKRTVAMTVTRAIDIGKSIDFPCIMFMAFYFAYDSSDIRSSMPFTRFLTALFKKYDISIPIDLIRIKLEKPINKYSLTRSGG